MALLRYVVPCGVTFLIIQLVCMIIMAKLSLILLWPGLNSARSNKSNVDKIFFRPRCLGESFEPTWSPIHYNLRLDINAEERVFQGEIIIRGKMLASASLIQLHSTNLTISHVALDGNETPFDVNDDEGILSLELPQIFDAGKSIEIEIKYEGIIMHEGSGILLKNISTGSPIVFSYLEPTSARKVFPCLDLPEYKATFGLSIRNPGKELTVLSNMPQIVDPSIPEPKYIKFKRSPLMSTYLLSFAIGDFVPVKASEKITFWVPEEKTAEIRWAAEAAPGLLEMLEVYVGVDYTLPKLDLFAAPDLGRIGAMENWGLIMMEESSFFIDETMNEQKRIIGLASLTHELAHNWFGNLVTVKNWCNTWVQEGITTYLHGLIGEQAFPWTNLVQYVKNQGRDIMEDEYYFNSQPLRVRKDIHPSNWSPFHAVAYYKGAFVLNMVESIVSRTVFRHALQSLVINNAYSNVTDVTLWEEVDKVAKYAGLKLPKSIKVLMKPWTIYEGHPVVTIFRDENTGKLTAKQQMFRRKGKRKQHWWIPLSYTTSRSPNMDDTSPKLWMPPKNTEFDMNLTLGNDEWIIINLKNAGYYRVNYDNRTWQLLAEQLESNHQIIDPVTRAMMIDDAFKLARDGRIEYDVPLGLTKYLINEKDVYVWKAASESLSNILPKKENEELKNPFKKYVQSLLDNIIPEISLKRVDSYALQQLSAAIFDLATTVDHPKIYNYINETVQQVMTGQILDSQIAPEIRNSLWCVAIRKGPPSIFLHRWNAYKAQTDPTAKAKILTWQLVCSVNNSAEVLTEIMETDKGEVLMTALLSFLLNHWETQCKMILPFIENNRDRIFANESDDSLDELQSYVVTFAPAECINDTKRIFNVNASSEGAWKNRKKFYRNQILNWLATNENSTSAG